MSTREEALRRLAKAQLVKSEMDRDRREARAAGKLRPREIRMVLLHCRGATKDMIAAELQVSPRSVERKLRQPIVRAEIDRITAAQRERIISGEFGVAAMAKAHATEMATTIINQATGKVDVKPETQLKAATIGLKLSGDLMEKKTHEHVVSLIRDLTTDELEEYQRTRQLPARVRESLSRLGIRTPAPAIDVTPS